MGWPFSVSALPLSLGVGYGYASFFRLSGAIKNSHPLIAFTHSFSMSSQPDSAPERQTAISVQAEALKQQGRRSPWDSLSQATSTRLARVAALLVARSQRSATLLQGGDTVLIFQAIVGG